ncbi:cupin domain-containing protein [Mycoplasma sp. P36-A1]|uniref:cupin domain-containing protein n=1 Tax=Mycoplasma sp. P36-A1 TaxID=3252900 RepID=UPI003C2F2CB8
MIEQVYKISTGNDKVIEKVLLDENIQYLHMVLNKDDGLPVHFVNSNVYMTVVRGKLSISLNDEKVNEYSNGTLLKIPNKTKMNVKNLNEDTLELIVVKAPAPIL